MRHEFARKTPPFSQPFVMPLETYLDPKLKRKRSNTNRHSLLMQVASATFAACLDLSVLRRAPLPDPAPIERTSKHL
jgi:hypothetical protein